MYVLYVTNVKYKIIRDMPVFNPKVFKASIVINKAKTSFKESIVEDANELINTILPSPFIIERNKVRYEVYDEIINKIINKEFYVNREFACTELLFAIVVDNLSPSAIRILCKLTALLQLNKNYIYLPNKVIETLCKLDTKSVIKGINELIINKVLARTNRKSIYVINHNILFKGDYKKFEDLYNAVFGDMDINDVIDDKDNKIHIPELNIEQETELLIKQLSKI